MRTAGNDRGGDRDGGSSEDPAPADSTHIAHDNSAHERTQRLVRPAETARNGADGPNEANGQHRATSDGHTRTFSRADYQGVLGDATEPPNGPRRDEATEPPDGSPPRDDVPSRPRRRRFRKRWIVALAMLVVLLSPFATWVWVWSTARGDARPQSDAIVVLGASQYNGDPSPIFEARLRHAAELHQEGVAPMIVTVGGNQPGDNYTEGGAGHDWLVETGVPADQVMSIDEGSDTLGSIQAVAHTFQDQKWHSSVIVTDPWHSLRSRQVARDLGIDAEASPVRSGPAVQERETQLWYITRETASLWYYWIFGDSSDIVVHAA